MPGHRRLQRMVGPYVDGELAAPVASIVAWHLRTCARCRDEATLFRRIKCSLRRSDASH